MCNCGNTHLIEAVTNNTASISLTASNSTDIGNLQPFNIIMRDRVNVSASPVPVTINVNGTDIPLKNRYGLQITSNRIPLGKSYGAYVIDNSTGTAAPYVILLTTPKCRCNA